MFLYVSAHLVGIIGQGSQVVQRPILNKQIQINEQGMVYILWKKLLEVRPMTGKSVPSDSLL